MGQTFTNLLLHIVFSTKGREPFISPDLRPCLYDYLGGFIRNRKGVLYEIGGMPDHLHILARLHPETMLTAYMRDLKGHSSRWVHDTFPERKAFKWQTGYAAFSVSQSLVPNVTRYIENQEAHHQKQSFQDELRALLDANGIEYDEKYLWD